MRQLKGPLALHLRQPFLFLPPVSLWRNSFHWILGRSSPGRSPPLWLARPFGWSLWTRDPPETRSCGGSTVPVQQRLSLPAAPRTACRDTHHRARCASKRAPGAGGLCGTVAELTGVTERRDKRTRLVHGNGGGRGVVLTPGESEERDMKTK